MTILVTALALMLGAPQPNMLNSSTWLLEERGEAQGAHVEADEATCLVKTNPLGAVVYRTSEPINVVAGSTYRFECNFRADDAPLGNLLLLRLAENVNFIHYDANDRTAGWVSQSILVNSAPGRWNRRAVTYTAKADGQVTPMIVLWGNPCNAWVRDLFMTDAKESIVGNPGPAFLSPFEQAEVLARLEQRPNSTASVETQNERTVLMVDGQPTLPTFYKVSPYTNEQGDEYAFGKDDVNLVTVPAKLGQNNDRPGAWSGPGQVDVKIIEEEIARALCRNPDARIILEWTIYPYLGWGDAHPQECWRNREGQRGYGFWGNLEGFADELPATVGGKRQMWWYPSYQSATWEREAGEAMAQVVEKLKQGPWWKAVVGAFIDGGHDGQFITGHVFDYSEPTRNGFRQWCKARYDGIGHLNRVWRTSLASFDAIDVPTLGEMGDSPEAVAPYVLPQGPLADYRRYLHTSSWAHRDAFAKVFKEHASKPVIALTYCGNNPLHYSQHLMSLKHLDGTGAMSYYPWRNPGYPAGFMLPDTAKMHGKLLFQELDLRSWVGSIHAGVYAGFIGAGLTPEDWDNTYRKLIGMCIVKGHGWWWYDMNRFFNDPAIHASIARGQEIAKVAAERPSKFRPDVALVVADDPTIAIGPFFSAVNTGGWFEAMHMECAGVPFDIHYLSDILTRPDLQQYKVYLFLHTPLLTYAERRGIDRTLKGGGRTLVWMHDAGYVADDGFNDHEMSQLIGIRVRADDRYTRLTAMTDAAAEHPLTRGLEPTNGASEQVLATMSLTGGNSFVARYQSFWIEDDQAAPLMKYLETGKVAAGVRRFKDWTSIYLAAPNSLSGAMLNNIARQAGAFVAAEPGQALYYSDTFASVHGIRNGPWRLHAPGNATDAMTGESLGRGEITLEMRAGETRWLMFDDSK